jgi:16S rRNA C967 or C1407 C5-methylase (RsmB/RsmF family)
MSKSAYNKYLKVNEKYYEMSENLVLKNLKLSIMGKLTESKKDKYNQKNVDIAYKWKDAVDNINIKYNEYFDYPEELVSMLEEAGFYADEDEYEDTTQTYVHAPVERYDPTPVIIERYTAPEPQRKKSSALVNAAGLAAITVGSYYAGKRLAKALL